MAGCCRLLKCGGPARGERVRTSKKRTMSGLVTVKGMPRSLSQPSWKGTSALLTDPCTMPASMGLPCIMVASAGLSAATPDMPGGRGPTCVSPAPHAPPQAHASATRSGAALHADNAKHHKSD